MYSGDGQHQESTLIHGDEFKNFLRSYLPSSGGVSVSQVSGKHGSNPDSGCKLKLNFGNVNISSLCACKCCLVYSLSGVLFGVFAVKCTVWCIYCQVSTVGCPAWCIHCKVSCGVFTFRRPVWCVDCQVFCLVYSLSGVLFGVLTVGCPAWCILCRVSWLMYSQQFIRKTAQYIG